MGVDEPRRSGINWQSIVHGLVGALWFVTTTLVIYMGTAIISNEQRSTERHAKLIQELGDINARVSAIESNRFTAKDAQQMMELMLEKLPPQWLIERVKENGQEIDFIKNEYLHKRRK
jgi:hypothetical protein